MNDEPMNPFPDLPKETIEPMTPDEPEKADEPAPLVYVRDHPEHGSSVHQYFYNFDGQHGALVTRFHGTGRKVVQAIRFVGVEVTNFVDHGESVVVTLEDEVRALLRRFRDTFITTE